MTDVLANLGYYDDPTQETPAHNPCFDAPCPACGERNGSEGISFRTIMQEGGSKSFFFLFHTACKNDPKIEAFERQAVDAALGWSVPQ